MGVRQWWAAQAVQATHVLVVEAPGGWLVRVAVERDLSRRGWHAALSPADAEVLVVAGEPGPELGERIEAVWAQLPGPRVRTAVTSCAEVEAALDRAASQLVDLTTQSRDASERGGLDLDASDDAGEMDTSADADEMEMEMDGDGMDMDMDMDMDMAPSGISLAEGGPDRDGLEMDVLHLPLGPVLPHWPAGLVLRCSVQGDVVVEAAASVLDADSHGGSAAQPALTPVQRAALRLDQVADVLSLAGWAQGRDAALGVRDALLDRESEEHPRAEDALQGLEQRLRRSRMLRWSLRDLGQAGPDTDPSVPTALHGDVLERTLGLIAAARDDLAGHGDDRHDIALDDVLALAAALVTGLELGAARLVVASLGIDTAPTRLASAQQPAHG